jgi:hypothetical protein
MSTPYELEEIEIQRALASFADEKNPNIRKLSRVRKVNYHRLLTSYNRR